MASSLLIGDAYHRAGGGITSSSRSIRGYGEVGLSSSKTMIGFSSSSSNLSPTNTILYSFNLHDVDIHGPWE
jgi:hypothetical protein